MNLLVGATGFVGGHVVEYLFQQNELSKGIFRKGAHLKIMDLNGVQGVEADILEHHSLHEAMDGVDTVYSMASPMPGSDANFVRINNEGLSNLLEVAQEAKVKSFVHLSTVDVYGFRESEIRVDSEPRPAGDYQLSKLHADGMLLEFAKRCNLPRITVVRAARAVGSRDQSLVAPLLRMIKSGSVALPASGMMSFSHPKDIAQAMHLAATRPDQRRNLYLIKSFDADTASFASSLSEATGARTMVKKEGLLSKSEFPSYTKEQLRAHLRFDSNDGWSDLGYVPKYDLQNTCEEIADWYRKEPWAAESG